MELVLYYNISFFKNVKYFKITLTNCVKEPIIAFLMLFTNMGHGDDLMIK